ncbi:hypothetical protein CDAR_555541 [Caerostris darwini]|uniref:Uncharacterized protein n=1 Tax=Caerostris darwini TaxID=1538125 RepID=A0AAV4QYW0_9ARAC|nr:hypothetical protein CDAR_555541 [Caerostris darwini]
MLHFLEGLRDGGLPEPFAFKLSIVVCRRPSLASFAGRKKSERGVSSARTFHFLIPRLDLQSRQLTHKWQIRNVPNPLLSNISPTITKPSRRLSHLPPDGALTVYQLVCTTPLPNPPRTRVFFQRRRAFLIQLSPNDPTARGIWQSSKNSNSEVCRLKM